MSSDCSRSIICEGSGSVWRATSSTARRSWSLSHGTPASRRWPATWWQASHSRSWSPGRSAERSKSTTFSGTSSTLAGSGGAMASSYWSSTERASWPTRVPTCSPAIRPPTPPTMSPTPGGPTPAPVPSASATRRAPGSTSGANPPRTASAQSGRFTGRAATATPGAGRLVTGSTQSSARRSRSSQERVSPGSGAAAGRGSWGIIPRSSAPAAVATATWRASSQLTGPLAVAISRANSRNNGIRPKKSPAPPGPSVMGLMLPAAHSVGSLGARHREEVEILARTVALIGALHPAARELALALEDDPGAERVLGLSRHEPPLLGPKFDFVQAGPGDPAFAGALAGVDTVVLFPLIDAADRNEEGRRARVVEGTRQALEAAAGAATVVLWSSGVVYGAHPGNPVPIPETHPTRPNPEVPAAGVLAESERVALDAPATDQAVVVLRGAGVWTPAWGTFLARGLMAPAMIGVRGQD